MHLSTLAIIAAGFLIFSMLSGKLKGTVITAPMVFIAFGYLIGPGVFNAVEVEIDQGVIHLIAEITLILVLFSDAARINVAQLIKDHNLPLRMLAFGLPITMIAGTVTATIIFPNFPLWEAALLAAILAPTDAALGQAVVSAHAVPVRIRQAINVESGLNDGIALPAVLLFAALASSSHGTDSNNWVLFAILQVTLGPLAGVFIGYFGGKLLDTAVEKGWVTNSFQGIGVLSLAFFTFSIAELVGGNGFIACFVGGLVFGNTIKHPCKFLFEFMEGDGELLILITFLIFGLTMLPAGIELLNPMYLLYALLSLTVIRMLPIAISLIGTGVRLPTHLFLGWFGPRGLASILFVLLILEESEIMYGTEILTVTVITVVLSAFLHGISAAPLANLYSKLVSSMGECQEIKPVCEIPLRNGLINKNNHQEI